MSLVVLLNSVSTARYFLVKNFNLQKSLKKTAELNDKAGYKRFASGVMGGAVGETFVADIEKIVEKEIDNRKI